MLKSNLLLAMACGLLALAIARPSEDRDQIYEKAFEDGHSAEDGHSIEKDGHSIEKDGHSIERDGHSIEKRSIPEKAEKDGHSVEKDGHSIEKDGHSIEQMAQAERVEEEPMIEKAPQAERVAEAQGPPGDPMIAGGQAAFRDFNTNADDARRKTIAIEEEIKRTLADKNKVEIKGAAPY